ncbi:MAG: WecB/TagA/CpsF family glycosyltransferase [Beijerinckiaceae bacterium]
MKQSRDPTLATVDGQPINIDTLDGAIASAIASARNQHGFSLFTLNLDHLVRLRHDTAFRAVYSRATYVTADGMPVAKLAQRQCASMKRTTGADLVVPLCREAARHGLPVFFFGASDRTLQAASQRLQKQFPGLIISGMRAPPQGFDPDSAEAEAYARLIAESGTRLCFIALGAPKQEIFAEKILSHDDTIGAIAIGAALDFLAGEKKRAPAFFQAYGLEWFWRLSTEPSRLFNRYMACATLLASIVSQEILHALAGRKAGHPGP